MPATAFFQIPGNRLIELGAQVEIWSVCGPDLLRSMAGSPADWLPGRSARGTWSGSARSGESGNRCRFLTPRLWLPLAF